MTILARITRRQAHLLTASSRLRRRGVYDSAYAAHWHPTSDGRYALSLLDQPDLLKHNAAIIGWSNQCNLQSPSAFKENPAFRNLLQAVIRDHAHSDPELQVLAKQQKLGWLHVSDYRNPAPWGRIPDPDDIFGSVLISNGEKDTEPTLLKNSYQPMPTHRLVSTMGLFVPSNYLKARLMETLHSLT